MRPRLVELVASYGAGLWAGLIIGIPPAAGVVVGAGGLVAAGSGGWGGILLGAGGLGSFTGVLAHQRQQHGCAARWLPGRHAVLLRVHDRPGARGLTTATVLWAPERCGGLLRVRAEPGSLAAGSRVVAVGAFRPPAVFKIQHARRLQGPAQLRYVVRDVLARRIEGLYGPRAGLVEALVLNRREDLDPRWRQRFADAGLAHLLAISGLHVGILAGWILVIARPLVRSPRAEVLGALATWLYVALLGFPAPATRAAGLVSLRALALARQRHPGLDALLAATVLLVLALDPLAATDVGAWLSVAATWGTGFALKRLPQPLRRHPVAALAASSVGATLATAPITAFAFGTVALVGVLSNLAAVPLAGLAVPAVLASLAIGAPAAAGAGLPLAATEWVAGVASAFPGGQVRGAPGWRFAAWWVGAVAMVLWLARGRVRLGARARSGVRLAAVLAGGAWALVAIPALTHRVGGGGLELHVLDVGQGDAIALRTPHGHWILIDGGPRSPVRDAGREVVVPYLRGQGARTLDLVIVTHGDADHLGGVPAVLDALVPGLVLEPGQPLGTPLYLDYQRVVDEQGVAWRAARAGDTVVLDSVVLAVLHPAGGWVAAHLAPNENSVVVRVSYGAFDAVLMGDAGLPAESVLAARGVRSEVLKVGHHGSAGATGERWLEAVGPAVAVISVGENRYGHPSPATLRRLAERRIRVYRTDRGGTVTIRSGGRYFEVVQGASRTWLGGIPCLLRRWLRSSDSSSSRSACTRAPPESYPVFSTTSP